MNMFLTNKTRLKIKDIVKRISIDEEVSLEERIYVEKFAKHNSTIWTWLKKANSLRRYGKQNTDGINGLIQSLGLDGLESENSSFNIHEKLLINPYFKLTVNIDFS